MHFQQYLIRYKKNLLLQKFNLNKYLKEIDKYKTDRPLNQFYYDYDKELDFSIDTKHPKSIEKKIYDERWYYYKAYHYQKLGLFLRKDVPHFKVSLSHLSPEMIYELSQLDEKDRKFVLNRTKTIINKGVYNRKVNIIFIKRIICFFKVQRL
jgi:hypothetical protein